MKSAMTLYRSLLIVLLFLIIHCTYAGDYRHKQSIDKSFAVGRGGSLYLESDLGSVTIQSHKANEVRVSVKMQAQQEKMFEEFEIDFARRGNDVNIKGEWKDKWGRRNQRLRIHYDILVPHEYDLDVRTAGGGIDVDDIIGDVSLNTSGGSIKMGSIDGEISANTSGGSISLHESTGEASVNTSGGSINIGNVGGSVTARTSGGSISIDAVDGDVEAKTSGGGIKVKSISGNLEAKTSGGSIRAHLTGQIDKPMELRTSGGGITLAVPGNFKADINASTSGGRVTTDLPVTVKGTIKKNSMRGEINGGGPEVYLRTSGGSIKITES